MNLIKTEPFEKIPPAESLRVGGFTPLTTIDYPGELAAVIFTQGCHLRCQYCQNGHLIPSRSDHLLPWNEIQTFLEKRTGLLDAVVFSGGEPTLQSALPSAINDIKAMGFKAGLHTVGSAPGKLARVITKLDWIGFDIKALPEDYAETTGIDKGKDCWESLRLMLESGVSYEVRTTIHWQLLPPEKVLKLAKRLQQEGVRHFVLQNCRTHHCLNQSLTPSILDEQHRKGINQELSELFPFYQTR
ncbi:anaerobic ribonucleoside-triphosphate reductase activating protein [Endozoicomonas lisbonensis]|uniref:Pyruvate formate lyase activating enzyme n=1 Tax=Endozoicomonas lisbonensis TaxID=3120522 RepID=A0ABV2SD95_9GAMM